MTKNERAICEDILNDIHKEKVFWSEIAWLTENQDVVLEYGDIELAQWAGISEEDWNGYQSQSQPSIR